MRKSRSSGLARGRPSSASSRFAVPTTSCTRGCGAWRRASCSRSPSASVLSASSTDAGSACSRCASAASCTASSCDGATTTACSPAPSVSRASSGTRNASVLPLPVAACSTTLAPSAISSIAFSWIGCACVYPASASRAESASSIASGPNEHAEAATAEQRGGTSRGGVRERQRSVINVIFDRARRDLVLLLAVEKNGGAHALRTPLPTLTPPATHALITAA